MYINIIDDFVWDHYNLFQGDDWSIYGKWRDCLPWYSFTHRGSIHAHAELKWNEHKDKYNKLWKFRRSLESKLQDCVDPFMEQQDKLRRFYFIIWLNTF